MITRFKVNNFRSYANGFDYTFSDEFLFGREQPDDAKNNVSMILGENGSGKTNFIDALDFLKQLAVGKVSPSSIQKNICKDIEKPKTIDFLIEFENKSEVLIYSVSIDTSDYNIVDESIIVRTDDGFEHKIISMVCGTRLIHSKTDTRHRLGPVSCCSTVLFSDLFYKSNFLNEMRKYKAVNYDNSVRYICLLRVFFDNLHIIRSNAVYGDYIDTKFTVDMLKNFGIDDDIESGYMTCGDVYNRILDRVCSDSEKCCYYFDQDSDASYFFDIWTNELVVEYFLVVYKQQKKRWKPGMLSEGTERLIQLSTLLDSNHNPEAIFIVDELDRKLHTNISLKLLEFFLNKRNSHQQMIFTTHESEFLDCNLIPEVNIKIIKCDKNGSSMKTCDEFDLDSDPKQLYIENNL